jgi:hypothetical protein
MQLLPYYDPRAMAAARGFERLVYERGRPQPAAAPRVR